MKYSNKQIEIRSNKQIVDKFSKETGIKDPIVDMFIAMQDNMPDLGHYHMLGSRNINTTYGVDPGHYAGWTWGTNSKQPSGDIYEEVIGGIWFEYFRTNLNKEKYYDGDWKYITLNDSTGKLLAKKELDYPLCNGNTLEIDWKITID